MPRVLGIDPGTVSIDACGLEDGRVVLDRSWPTREALAEPERWLDALWAEGPWALVYGPAGYGLPLVPASALTDEDLTLAYLAAPGDGGIGGLRRLARVMRERGLPVVFGPGVVHLASVPAHRKLNRVDLGTADKVASAALAIDREARRLAVAPAAVRCLLLELGGAFTAALAIAGGCIVDGLGGTSGPIGWQAAGALDGEVAFLAGMIEKDRLFRGGAAAVAGVDMAREAYVEGAVKAVAQLRVSAPEATTVLLSGRMARDEGIRAALEAALPPGLAVRALEGFASVAKEGAQGAALLADGLAGGAAAPLVEAMGLRAARGTVLDHLLVVSPAEARRRLGLAA